MPAALIPAIIGIVGSVVSAATRKKGGAEDLRTEGQKSVDAEIPKDFSNLDAFNSTLNPLRIGASVSKYQDPAQAAHGINFMQNIPVSPSAPPMQPTGLNQNKMFG